MTKPSDCESGSRYDKVCSNGQRSIRLFQMICSVNSTMFFGSKETQESHTDVLVDGFRNTYGRLMLKVHRELSLVNVCV